MPELPEVEIVRQSLDKKIKQKRVKKVIIRNRNLRYLLPNNFKSYIKNKKIIKVERFSKYLIIHFLEGDYCLVHLGMSGTIHIVDKFNLSKFTNTSFYHSPILPKKHNHVEFEFDNFKVIYNDPRRFGFFQLIANNSALKKSGGVINELSHELDYANWFFGPFDKLQAALQNSGTLDIDVEDGAELLLQTETGLTVSIHLDFYSKTPKRHCRVQTTTGELVWDALKQAVCWTDASGQTTEKFFPQERDELFRRQLLHFFECVQGVSQPMVPIDQGTQVMKMIDAARASHDSGRRITL